jgi:hypothetical protein
MINKLDIVAGAFITIWALGFFGLDAGMMIHLLLILAAISVIVRVTSETTGLKEEEE